VATMRSVSVHDASFVVINREDAHFPRMPPLQSIGGRTVLDSLSATGIIKTIDRHSF